MLEGKQPDRGATFGRPPRGTVMHDEEQVEGEEREEGQEKLETTRTGLRSSFTLKGRINQKKEVMLWNSIVGKRVVPMVSTIVLTKTNMSDRSPLGARHPTEMGHFNPHH